MVAQKRAPTLPGWVALPDHAFGDGRLSHRKAENDVIGEPTLGDAILDRIVHNAYRLELDGPSMRKIKAAETTEPAATNAADDKQKGAKK